MIKKFIGWFPPLANKRTIHFNLRYDNVGPFLLLVEFSKSSPKWWIFKIFRADWSCGTFIVVNRIFDFPFVDLIGTRGRFWFNCEHYSFYAPPPSNTILTRIFNRFWKKTKEMGKSFSIAKTYFSVGWFYWDLRFIKRYGRPFFERKFCEFGK